MKTVAGIFGALFGIFPCLGHAAPQGGVPVFHPGPCLIDNTGEHPQCGYVEVPEDRAQPSGPKVRLALMRFTRHDLASHERPIVYLHGEGAGSLAFDGVAGSSFDSKVKSFLDKRDVILFDQRGVGQSTPSLDCPEFPNLIMPDASHFIHPSDYMPTMLKAANLCASRLRAEGVSPENFNSNANADDADDIRRALDISSWDITGSSYGSRLGLNVIRRHPLGVHAAVLSSILPPQLSFDVQKPLVQLETKYFAAHPGLQQVLQSMIAQLNREPVTLTTELSIPGFPWSGKPVSWLFSGDQLSGLLFGELYSPKGGDIFASLIAKLAAGDVSQLPSIVASNFVLPLDLTNLGSFLALECNDGYSTVSKEELQQYIDQNPELGALMYGRGLAWGAGIVDMCHTFVAPSAVDPEFRNPVQSSLPVLLVSGEFDSATPPENAEIAAQGLSNSQLVVVPGAAHDSMFSGPCPISLTRAFLDNPAAKLDLSCLDRPRPVLK